MRGEDRVGFLKAVDESREGGRMALAYAGYGYFEAYHLAPLLCYFVSSDELGNTPHAVSGAGNNR